MAPFKKKMIFNYMFAATDNPVLNQALGIHFHHSKVELALAGLA